MKLAARSATFDPAIVHLLFDNSNALAGRCARIVHQLHKTRRVLRARHCRCAHELPSRGAKATCKIKEFCTPLWDPLPSAHFQLEVSQELSTMAQKHARAKTSGAREIMSFAPRYAKQASKTQDSNTAVSRAAHPPAASPLLRRRDSQSPPGEPRARPRSERAEAGRRCSPSRSAAASRLRRHPSFARPGSGPSAAGVG